jgi:hypothetical protein
MDEDPLKINLPSNSRKCGCGYFKIDQICESIHRNANCHPLGSHMVRKEFRIKYNTDNINSNSIEGKEKVGSRDSHPESRNISTRFSKFCNHSGFNYQPGTGTSKSRHR